MDVIHFVVNIPLSKRPSHLSDSAVDGRKRRNYNKNEHFPGKWGRFAVFVCAPENLIDENKGTEKNGMKRYGNRKIWRTAHQPASICTAPIECTFDYAKALARCGLKYMINRTNIPKSISDAAVCRRAQAFWLGFGSRAINKQNVDSNASVYRCTECHTKYACYRMQLIRYIFVARRKWCKGNTTNIHKLIGIWTGVWGKQTERERVRAKAKKEKAIERFKWKALPRKIPIVSSWRSHELCMQPAAKKIVVAHWIFFSNSSLRPINANYLVDPNTSILQMNARSQLNWPVQLAFRLFCISGSNLWKTTDSKWVTAGHRQHTCMINGWRKRRKMYLIETKPHLLGDILIVCHIWTRRSKTLIFGCILHIHTTILASSSMHGIFVTRCARVCVYGKRVVHVWWGEMV